MLKLFAALTTIQRREVEQTQQRLNIVRAEWFQQVGPMPFSVFAFGLFLGIAVKQLPKLFGLEAGGCL
jgi:hypothetical protein